MKDDNGIINRSLLGELSSSSSIDFLLDTIPGNVFVMDENWKLLECNDHQATVSGFDKKEDIIGTTIFDFGDLVGWDESIPETIANHNQQVFQSNKSIVTEEIVILDDKPRIYLSHKSPLLNKKNCVIGIVGIATDITDIKYSTQSLSIKLRHCFPEVNITPREVDCLICFMQGHTSKMIAKKLKISHYTVNDHLESIKRKFNCDNKPQLLVELYAGIFTS